MISIITPTYNRAHTLLNLFDSLINQTNHNFEWIIINDGSVDDTEAIIDRILHNNQGFDIVYYKQINKGKHVAVNKGIEFAKGEYTIIVDSDDTLSLDAIDKIIRWSGSIANEPTIAGVAGLKGFSLQKMVGSHPFFGKQESYIDANNIERKSKKLLGDKAEVYKTEILREYPFPTFNDEKFMSEAIVWDRIARDGYKLRWYNEIIYICDYNIDGLTMQGNDLFVNNYVGFTCYIKQSVKFYPLISKFSFIELFLSVSKERGVEYKEAISLIDVSFLLYILTIIRKYMLRVIRKRSIYD